MKGKVSIIYVYYNTPRELELSVNSVKRAVGKFTYEIIIVDNDSPKKIPRRLLGNKRIKVIKNKNTGYGAGLNSGVRFSHGESLILSNPDVVFAPLSIEKLVKKSQDKKTGIVGPQMIGKNSEVLPTISGKTTPLSLVFATSIIGRLFPNTNIGRKFWLPKLNRKKEQKVDVISGACIAMRREVFEEVGGFDERFFMYFEENDLCLRIKKSGYTVLYFPEAKIFHEIGASSQDKEAIEGKYQKSRFLFLKKYNPFYMAITTEAILRFLTLSGALLTLAVMSSLFLNLYLISSHMLFIGDFGRDYLAAREMILTGNIPLVGIPSSVVWLHQGPLSIYFIAFALLVGKFNPIAPAIFYSLIGTLTVGLVYFFTNIWFGRRAAGFASLFYATSPLVVISARLPYHTSSIPFFATTFFILITFLLKGRKNLAPLAAFNFGLLLMLELSNAVLVLIVGILYVVRKPKFTGRQLLLVAVGFFTGILPFILYDITHNFIQTIGFPLWIINRIRLFLGLASSEKITTGNLPEAIHRIYQQYTGIVFPENQFVAALIGFSFLILIFLRIRKVKVLKKITGMHLIFLWLLVPIVGFLIHAAPGVAYFPLLFPVISVCIGLTFFFLYSYRKIFITIFIVICCGNAFFLIANEYYVSTPFTQRGLPPYNYRYGISFASQNEAAMAIVNDSAGKQFSLSGGGFLGKLVTGIDNYSYLVWYHKGSINPNASLQYILYEDQTAIERRENVIFSNGLVFVERRNR